MFAAHQHLLYGLFFVVCALVTLSAFFRAVEKGRVVVGLHKYGRTTRPWGFWFYALFYLTVGMMFLYGATMELLQL